MDPSKAVATGTQESDVGANYLAEDQQTARRTEISTARESTLAMVPIRFLLVLAAIPTLPGQAHAGVITMETSARTVFDRGAVRLEIELTNRGDDEARRVRIEADFQGSPATAENEKAIGPGEQWNTSLSWKAADLGPGTYPIQVAATFEDAAAYPFSAVSVVPFVVGESRGAAISTRVQPELTVHGAADLAFDLTNLDEKPKRVAFSVLAARELRVSPSAQSLLVGPNDTAIVRVKVENLSALQGATYPIFGLFEYEDDSHHFLTIASSTVLVAESGSRSQSAPPREKEEGVLWILALVGAVAAIRIAYPRLARIRKRAGGKPTGSDSTHQLGGQE